MRLLMIVSYVATIPAANWLIGNVGTMCIPQGPCLVPVAPGILAPSGVLMIGTALLLRDLVQRACGVAVSIACIIVGAGLSAFLAPAALVLASAVAFLFSEFTDLAVFTPLYRRRLIAAVVLSCAAGAVIDSVLFLWLAFGSLDHLLGQVIGKGYAAAIFSAYVGVRRHESVA